MVKLCITLFLFVSFSGFSLAQNLFNIEGRVVDDSEGRPLVGAAVVVHETGGGTYTDSLGEFKIELQRGSYHLHVSYYGYETEYINVRASSGTSDLLVRLKATTIELKQVVVEGEHLKTKAAKQPLSITVVDEEFLEKNQDNTLSESLDRIAGVSSANTGTGISKPVIRGMTGNRIIVNEGGIKQEGQQWGAEHGLEIDQAGVGQVEIIKGPASYLYGSDGLGGVLNIEPLPAPDPNSFESDLSTTYRSNNNLYGLSASSAYRAERSWIRARYSLQDYGDYQVPADSFAYLNFVFPIEESSLRNTAGNIQSGSIAFGTIQPWGKVSLTISDYFQKAGFFSGAVGIPGFYSLQSDGNNRDVDLPFQEINHFKIRSNAEVFINENWLEIDAGYQNNLRTEHSSPHAHIVNAPPITSTVAHRWVLQTFSLNTHYHLDLSDSLSLITGFSGEYQTNQRSGFEFLLPDYKRGGVGLFVFSQYSINKSLNFSAGLRGDYSSIDISRYLQPVYNTNQEIESFNERVPAIDRSFFNWSGGLGLAWEINNHINTKFNVGRSFRMPSVPELSMNGVHHGTSRHEKGDAGLDSEKGYQFDFAFNYERKNYFLSATPFFNYYSNFIYLKPTVTFSPLPGGGQMYQYSQASSYFTGFEVEAEYHPWEKLHLLSNAEYVHTYNFDNGLPLPFIPPFSWFSDIEYQLFEKIKAFEEVFIGVEYRVVASQNRVDRNEKTTPGYDLVNVVAGTTVNTKNHKFGLFFRVNNLTNEFYLKHLSRYRILNLPEQGRNFMVTFKWEM